MAVTNVRRSMWGCIFGIRIPAVAARCLSRGGDIGDLPVDVDAPLAGGVLAASHGHGREVDAGVGAPIPPSVSPDGDAGRRHSG
jgi:hypothetical protein